MFVIPKDFARQTKTITALMVRSGLSSCLRY
jgi:hypothetical protein